ncbi:MAG: aminotransferase class III-fold pyridoxal phosphate-dependent enzyme, partial [Rhodospirillales bacterium]|nr:aminotransferase class III-fold pyridoxal phosphate-dependent enzyme [Rhodospirillales bacterium]
MWSYSGAQRGPFELLLAPKGFRLDYFGGHGALLLGHNHPQVLAAMHSALDAGTHFGASHALELRWAQAVQRMVPCAERVRFTSSGTEATLLALRLARAHTGKSKIIHFSTHFHGWQDHVTSGYSSHFDGAPTTGVLPGVAQQSILLRPGDIDAVAAVLAEGEVAAVILEPTGATFGLVPVDPDHLAALRELTSKHDTVLVFDEVVTGFRVSPGGAQAALGVIPDLATFAKILAGGLPGGAVVGRKDILDLLDFEAEVRAGREKIAHQGTFNANPVSAAAGAQALDIIATTDACEEANAYAAALRKGLNQAIEAEGVAWAAYGTYSGFHIFTNTGKRPITPSKFDSFDYAFEELKANPPEVVTKLRLAMLVNGVDITAWPGGTVSAAHDEDDLKKTVAAFRKSLVMLKSEGEL